MTKVRFESEKLARTELHELSPAPHVRDKVEQLPHCEDEILIDRHFARGGEPVAGAAEGEFCVCRRRDAVGAIGFLLWPFEDDALFTQRMQIAEEFEAVVGIRKPPTPRGRPIPRGCRAGRGIRQ